MEEADSTPDLQSILSTLARFAPPVQPQNAADSNERLLTSGSVPPEQSGFVLPFEKAEDPRLRPQSRSGASPQPIDPATITTWQDGLRCTTKIAAQNAQFAVSIRKVSRARLYSLDG